jgi:hypothetical protein
MIFRKSCTWALYLAVQDKCFGQVLSPKAVQHLTDVAEREMESFRQAPLDDTPSVVIVDGVNIKVLLPTSTYSTNQRGQRRQMKRREEQVILAALGVWPDGRYQVIYFEMVEKETADCSNPGPAGKSSSATY